eukprot:CCRYP_004589-RA/>CCRYP_004589-RA protein AED:0.05 eAED:0.05 QI:2097/0/0.5/1/0/0/2/518/84
MSIALHSPKYVNTAFPSSVPGCTIALNTSSVNTSSHGLNSSFNVTPEEGAGGTRGAPSSTLAQKHKVDRSWQKSLESQRTSEAI